MKIKAANKIQMLVAGLLIMGSGSIFGQTIEEAAELFNAGRTLITEGKNKEAIDKLESSLKMCNLLPEDTSGQVSQLKTQIQSVIPSLYYGHAKSLYDNNQIDASIAAYKTTLEIAKQYNNPEVFTNTKDVLAQLFLKNGNDLFKAKDYSGALSNLEQSLKYDSLNTSTLILVAYSQRRLENTTEMVNYFKATITAAQPKDKNAPKAVEGLMTHYMTTGAKLINSKNTADGLKYLDTAATYGENGDLYFYYAVGYNAEQKYDQAIVAAEKAISLDMNNKENVAKYSFEMGTAYYAKKDMVKACEAYKNANFGRTGLRAEPMLKTLKCQ